MISSTPTPMARVLACPGCGTGLDPGAFNPAVVCPQCHARLESYFFPLYWVPRSRQITSGETAEDGDAACFFHAHKKAAVSCERCGRFVCGLCDMEIGAEHLCPNCLDTDLQGQKSDRFVQTRFCWAKMGLCFGILPVLLGVVFWPMFVVSGPAAVFAGVWGWRRPGSLVKGSRKWALAVGAVFGLVQMALWMGAIFFFWRLKTRG